MHGTPRDAKPVERTPATPGLTPSDALGEIARRSPVPNVVRACHRFQLQVWVTDGQRGFFTTWATFDGSASEALAAQKAMLDVGLQVHLIDTAVARPITSARAF